MATRRSSLGAGINQAAQAIAGAVNRADDIARAEEQQAVENTRADIAQGMQQEQIDIARLAEERLSRNADFEQANTVIGQLGEMTGAQAVLMFGDSTVAQNLQNSFSAEELEGFTLNEDSAERLRLDFLQEDIRIGRLEGASQADIDRMGIARNILGGRGAATDSQLGLASTDATTRLQIQVQEGEQILRRAHEDPSTLTDDGFLREPYVSTLFGITTNDPEQALELIKLEQANLAVAGSSGAAQRDRIGDLRDIYIKQADDRGISLDPIETERIISAVTSGVVPEGFDDMGAFLLDRMAAKPEAAEFYQQIIAGGYTPRALGADNPEEAFRQIQEDFPGEENENLREFLTQQVAALAAPSSRVLIESDGGFFGRRGFEAGLTPGVPVDFSDPEQMDAFVSAAAEEVRSGARTIEEIGEINLEAANALHDMVSAGGLQETVPADISSFIRRFQGGENAQVAERSTLMNLGMTRTEAGQARGFMNQIRQAEQNIEAGTGARGLAGRDPQVALAAAETALQAILDGVHGRGR